MVVDMDGGWIWWGRWEWALTGIAEVQERRHNLSQRLHRTNAVGIFVIQIMSLERLTMIRGLIPHTKSIRHAVPRKSIHCGRHAKESAC